MSTHVAAAAVRDAPARTRKRAHDDADGSRAMRDQFRPVDEERGMPSVPAVAERAAYVRARSVTAMHAANAGANNPW